MYWANQNQKKNRSRTWIDCERHASFSWFIIEPDVLMEWLNQNVLTGLVAAYLGWLKWATSYQTCLQTLQKLINITLKQTVHVDGEVPCFRVIPTNIQRSRLNQAHTTKHNVRLWLPRKSEKIAKKSPGPVIPNISYCQTLANSALMLQQSE